MNPFAPEAGSCEGVLTSPGAGCKGRCHSWMRRPQWPASEAAPQKSPEQEGTAAKAARRSPAEAGRTGIPVGCGRGSGPNERSAAGTGVPPGETFIQKCYFQHFLFLHKPGRSKTGNSVSCLGQAVKQYLHRNMTNTGRRLRILKVDSFNVFGWRQDK